MTLDTPSYGHLSPDAMEIGLQVASVGVGTVDYVRDTVVLDVLSAELFGLPAHQDIPRSEFHAKIHPEDWGEISEHVDALLDPHAPDVLNLRHRVLHNDGSVRWVEARKKVVFESRDAGARPVNGVFAVVDVTERYKAELQTEILIGEMRHRTKNLITVVSSIARQLQRFSKAEEFPARLLERLQALAANQDAIGGDETASFSLRGVVERQLAPAGDAKTAAISLEGRPLQITSDAALAFSMITHELLTNAMKYGALSAEDGRIAISWEGAEDEAHTSFIWREETANPVTPPDSTGFGHQVLTVLARLLLDAEVDLEFRESGLSATFVIPNERLLAG